MRGMGATAAVCAIVLAACSGADQDSQPPATASSPAAVTEAPQAVGTVNDPAALVSAWVTAAGVAAGNGPTALARFVVVSRHPDVDADGCVPPFADRLVETPDALADADIAAMDDGSFRVTGAELEIDVALVGDWVHHMEGCGGDDGLLLAAEQELDARAAQRAANAAPAPKAHSRSSSEATTGAVAAGRHDPTPSPTHKAEPRPDPTTDPTPRDGKLPAPEKPPTASPEPVQTAPPATLQRDKYAAYSEDPTGDAMWSPHGPGFGDSAPGALWVDILAGAAANRSDRWSLGVELAASHPDTTVLFTVCLDADCTMNPAEDLFVYVIRSQPGGGWTTSVRDGQMTEEVFPPRLLERQMRCMGIGTNASPETPWLIEIDVLIDERCLGFPPPEQVWVKGRTSAPAGGSATFGDATRLLGPAVRN